MYKKYIFLILLFCCPFPLLAQHLFVASYNIRYYNEGDVTNGNGWDARKDALCDFLNFEQPDIFGCQEVVVNQLHDMSARLKGYSWIGQGRDDGKEKGEFEPIFYNSSKISLISQGFFWLAPDPAKPAKGWDADCFRICTYGKFRENKTGFTFFFFNLHLSYKPIAQRESAKLVIKKIRAITKDYPTILTGDFNVDQNNEVYKGFTESGIFKDCYTSAKQRFVENGTFNSSNPNAYTINRIDHIFVSPSSDVEHYAIHNDTYWASNKTEYERRTISDHYPVMAKINFKNK